MNAKKPSHTPIYQLSVDNNELLIGEYSISRLAERVGKTPFYAYDRACINNKIARLREHIPDNVKIHYAIKANPMPALVQHMATVVDGFDLASQAEMKVALDTNMSGDKISIAGPGKSHKDLSCAIASGVTINIESESELSRIIKLEKKLRIKPRVAIRINPDFELKSSGMKMGGGAKQFGVDAERVPELINKIKANNIEFIGFHIYSGSQNLNIDSIKESQEKTLDLAIKLKKECNISLEKLNLGGGLGIPYFPGEIPLDIKTIGENLDIAVSTRQRDLKNTQIVMELGRFLVGEAGVYICKIVDKKISRGHTFLVTDGGLHHHLAASGNFGQVIRKNYPVAIANKISSEITENVSVVGPLCTPLDILADKIDLPIAEVGDYIAVFQSGAYGLTASPLNFLSQPLPEEVLV